MVTNDLDGKPFQLKFIRAAQMIMFANVICDPAFGQTTVIPYGQARVRTMPVKSSLKYRGPDTVKGNVLCAYRIKHFLS